MAKAQLRKELRFETADEKGVLAKVCEACSNAGVNIEAIAAYGQEGKGSFMLCTSDNAKAAEAMKALGYDATESDVVMLELENAPGKMAEVAKKISDAGVNVKYVYASAVGAGPAFVVLNSEDNAKVVELLQ